MGFDELVEEIADTNIATIKSFDSTKENFIKGMTAMNDNKEPYKYLEDIKAEASNHSDRPESLFEMIDFMKLQFELITSKLEESASTVDGGGKKRIKQTKRRRHTKRRKSTKKRRPTIRRRARKLSRVR